jgi:hypothetical protein
MRRALRRRARVAKPQCELEPVHCGQGRDGPSTTTMKNVVASRARRRSSLSVTDRAERVEGTAERGAWAGVWFRGGGSRGITEVEDGVNH